MKHVHPFPARMAPELALAAMEGLGAGARVLDPMVGSGTVVRHASLAGHSAVGFDFDPLAVLISRVSSVRVSLEKLESLSADILARVAELRVRDVVLPWIDSCEETTRFVSYWFGRRQSNALRKLAYAFREAESRGDHIERHHINVLKIALSRIIITKDSGASLARDVSHSRPHKVQEFSDYDVIKGFRRSVKQVIKFLTDEQPTQDAQVERGDARELNKVADASVDLVLTSPPYLNGIDYLRGHKFSLVWFGYTIDQLRTIRSNSIGSERSLRTEGDADLLRVQSAMVSSELPARFRCMVARYATDILRTIREISRVLKPTGKAVFVVGDSCVRSVFVSNSDGVRQAATLHGLRLVSRTSRELPASSRYLPITNTGDLSKRLRIENVLTFCPTLKRFCRSQ